jgi:hypothetical protein
LANKYRVPGFKACKEPNDSAYFTECVDISSNWDLLIATATQVKAHNAFSWRKYKRFYLGESEEVDG